MHQDNKLLILLARLQPNFQSIKDRFHFFLLLMTLTVGLNACRSTAPHWQWERAEAGLPRKAIVLTLAVDPANRERVWAGAYGPDGLAASHDGGRTWSFGASPFNGDPIFDLLVVPASGEGSGELWAATRRGLFTSLDAGAGWKAGGNSLPVAAAFALAGDATGRLYAGLDNAGVFARSQNETGWASLAADTELASAAVLALAVAPDGRQLYAGTAAQGIFASQDGGRTWVQTYAAAYVPNIALHPADPTLAVASLRTRLVRTVDGGRSWHTLPLPWAESEITSLLWLADGTLGAGTGRGGLYRSQDGGDSWVSGQIGSEASGSVLALALAGEPLPNRSPNLLAGAWTGLYASEDGGQIWADPAPILGVPHAQALLTTDTGLLLGANAGLFRWELETSQWAPLAGEFLPGGVAALAAPQADSPVLYAGTTGDGVYRSDDRGESWQSVPSLSVGVPALAVDPTDPEHITMLARWERVYESHNGGQSWQARWAGLGVTVETASLAIDPVKPVVYVGADTGLYRSHSGADWELVAPTIADQTVLALLAQPIPPTSGGGSVLTIGATRGIYRSLNGGETVQGGSSESGWGHGLENVSVTTLLADPARPERLYAGTAYNGVFQSVDWGRTWQPIGPTDLTQDVVEAMAWGPDGDLFIAAASGVWRGKAR
jgi:hypothetical protein